MDNINPTPPVEPQGSNKNLVIGLFTAIVVLATIVGFLFFLNRKEEAKVADSNQTQTQTQNQEQQIAGWQTSVNTEYGFEFKYPSNYTTNTFTDSKVPGVLFAENIVGPQKETNAGPPSYMNVSVWDNSKQLSLLDWATANANFSNYASHDASSSLKNLTLSGHEAISYSWQGEGYGKTAVIANGQTIILLDTLVTNKSDQTLQDFDSVLSNFKFINQDEATDWKTYKNPELGFEFQYLNNWNAEEGLEDGIQGLHLVEKTDEMGSGTVTISKEKLKTTLQDFINANNKGFKVLVNKKVSSPAGDWTYQVVQDVRESTLQFISVYIEKNGEIYTIGSRDFSSTDELINKLLPTFKFTDQSETANWKTYTSKSFGFSIQYPNSITLREEQNDEYGNRAAIFTKEASGDRFQVRLDKDNNPEMGVKYGYLGADIAATNVKLGGVNGFEAVSETGYGDAGVQGKPYVEFAARHNGDVYHLVFFGDALTSEEELQILSTFKFTNY